MEVNLRRVNENQALIGGVSFNLVFMHLAGFFVHSAYSYWLLRGHTTSNSKTVSRQKTRSEQHCKGYDVRDKLRKKFATIQSFQYFFATKTIWPD